MVSLKRKWNEVIQSAKNTSSNCQIYSMMQTIVASITVVKKNRDLHNIPAGKVTVTHLNW